MPDDPSSSPHRDQTLVRARELRERYARAAALYAYRIERARATERSDAVAHWKAEYQLRWWMSTARWLLLTSPGKSRRSTLSGAARCSHGPSEVRA
jgi:hypothetical protein